MTKTLSEIEEDAKKLVVGLGRNDCEFRATVYLLSAINLETTDKSKIQKFTHYEKYEIHAWQRNARKFGIFGRGVVYLSDWLMKDVGRILGYEGRALVAFTVKRSKAGG